MTMLLFELITSVVVLVKIVVLLLGGLVSLLAYRAYKRTRVAGLQYFGFGLAVITLGTALVGGLHHTVGIQLMLGLLLESLIICAGFLVIMVGLYGQ